MSVSTHHITISHAHRKPHQPRQDKILKKDGIAIVMFYTTE